MKKIILGINDEHDAGCALIEDGQIIAAYEEERFSRIKQHNGQSDGLPEKSLKNILEDFSIKPSDIDYVAFNFPKGGYLMRQIYRELLREKCLKWWLAGFLNKDFHGIGDYIYPYFYITKRKYRLKKILKKFGIKPKKIIYTDHHIAHAAGAYYTSGLNHALVFTLDGQGSGLSGSISVGKNGRLIRKSTISKYNSIGLLYSTITAGLGFRAGRHEGKILGLAAMGNPDIFYNKFKDIFKTNALDFNFELMRKYPSPIYPHFISLKRIFKKAFTPWYNGKREDISASLQKRTEDIIVKWVKTAILKFRINNITVSGGVFSNVKVNQRISELSEVDSLHVFPAMSDCGLAAGAALYAYYKIFKLDSNITKFNHAYLGKEFSNDEIKKTFNELDIPCKYYDNIEEEIAALLNESRVVARYNGRTEYGPRALGNRSILYNGKDRNVNLWLNKKLNRTEFMPFAPSSLEEDAHLYYKNTDSIEKFPNPAHFMTITLDCTEEMMKDCPAAVHVDNTARPQFVSKKTNPSYYRIIEEYKKLSGSGTIVNTSFNAHEAPIVNSPKDAIYSFLMTRLDALAIGNYLVLKEDL